MSVPEHEKTARSKERAASTSCIAVSLRLRQILRGHTADGGNSPCHSGRRACAYIVNAHSGSHWAERFVHNAYVGSGRRGSTGQDTSHILTVGAIASRRLKTERCIEVAAGSKGCLSAGYTDSGERG